MESFENIRCPCVLVTVCDNPSNCVLNTLQFVRVETGQTPEERVAVIKETTHQGISCQDSSLISQVLESFDAHIYYPLRYTSLISVCDVISQGFNCTRLRFLRGKSLHHVNCFPYGFINYWNNKVCYTS